MKTFLAFACVALAAAVAAVLNRMEDPRHAIGWTRYAVDHVLYRMFGDFENTSDTLHCDNGRDAYFREDPIFGNTLDRYPEDKPIPFTPMVEVAAAEIFMDRNLLRRVSEDFSRPVIVRGFLQSSTAWKYLNLQWLAESQGDEVYSFFSDSTGTTPTTELATMKMFYENITNGGAMYMTDTGWGFRHPDILEDMELSRLGDFPLPLGNVPFVSRSIQPFLGGYSTAPGVGNTTNTNETVGSGFAWHSAPTLNAFVLFQGEKWWKIIDPKYQAYLSPNVQRANQFATSCKTANKEFWEADLEFQNLPRWEGRVRSGDVLFNPAWFWHHVRNIPSAGPVLSFTTRHNYVPHDWRNNFMAAFLSEFTLLHNQETRMSKLVSVVPGAKSAVRLMVETFNLWDRLPVFQPTVATAKAKGWSPQNSTAIMKKMAQTHGSTTGGGGTKTGSFGRAEIELYDSGFDFDGRLSALKANNFRFPAS